MIYLAIKHLDKFDVVALIYKAINKKVQLVQLIKEKCANLHHSGLKN